MNPLPGLLSVQEVLFTALCPQKQEVSSIAATNYERSKKGVKIDVYQ